MSVLSLSLEDLENDIEGCIQNGAFMIYWNHQFDRFDYLLACDKVIVAQELTNLKKWLNEGGILSINKGVVVEVRGTQLYPLEVEFKTMNCPAYFMVTRRGQTDEMAITPYFFQSMEQLNECYNYIMAK